MAMSLASPNVVNADPVDVLTSFVVMGKREMSEQTLLDAVYEALCIDAGLPPGRQPKLTFRLHEADLLKRAAVDHVERGNHRIDFAWPAKRIAGLLDGGDAA